MTSMSWNSAFSYPIFLVLGSLKSVQMPWLQPFCLLPAGQMLLATSVEEDTFWKILPERFRLCKGGSSGYLQWKDLFTSSCCNCGH